MIRGFPLDGAEWAGKADLQRLFFLVDHVKDHEFGHLGVIGGKQKFIEKCEGETRQTHRQSETDRDIVNNKARQGKARPGKARLYQHNTAQYNTIQGKARQEDIINKSAQHHQVLRPFDDPHEGIGRLDLFRGEGSRVTTHYGWRSSRSSTVESSSSSSSTSSTMESSGSTSTLILLTTERRA